MRLFLSPPSINKYLSTVQTWLSRPIIDRRPRMFVPLLNIRPPLFHVFRLFDRGQLLCRPSIRVWWICVARKPGFMPYIHVRYNSSDLAIAPPHLTISHISDPPWLLNANFGWSQNISGHASGSGGNVRTFFSISLCIQTSACDACSRVQQLQRIGGPTWGTAGRDRQNQCRSGGRKRADDGGNIGSGRMCR
jgi:hypothetical protein